VLAIQQQQEEERIRQLKNATPKTRDCLVCYETTPSSEFPALKNCEHDPQVCADCYKSSIASQLDSKSWNEIQCPESGCKELLKHADVQQYAAREVFAKYAPPGECIFVITAYLEC
jgi:E3 ubiquitin-protein ligase RNF14